jgi:hypothetical protein
MSLIICASFFVLVLLFLFFLVFLFLLPILEFLNRLLADLVHVRLWDRFVNVLHRHIRLHNLGEPVWILCQYGLLAHQLESRGDERVFPGRATLAWFAKRLAMTPITLLEDGHGNGHVNAQAC